MDKKYLAITIMLFLLVMAGGAVFYFTEIAPQSQPVAALPIASDSSSPLNKFPSDFSAGRQGNASSTLADNPGTSSQTLPEQKVGEVVLLSQNADGKAASTGAVVFLKDKKKGVEAVRYVERGTGNIYETDLATLQSSRLTDVTIPKIIESIWTPDGQGVYLRFLKDGTESISTLFANLAQLTGTTTSSELPTSALPQDILGIATAGPKALFLGRDSAGSFGILNDLADRKKGSTVWRSPLGEWNADWKGTSIALSTKASASAPGFLFFLNSSADTETIILRDLNALSVVSNPDSSKVLYSDIGSGGLETKILTLKSGKTDLVPAKTLAEKCVWSAKENYTVYCAVPTSVPSDIPDAWYRGTVSFDDQIMKIDMKTGTTNIILAADPKNTFDAENLMLSPNEDYLVFTDKDDLTLWSLKLK